MAGQGAQTVLAVALHACTTTSPSPHAEQSEQARSAVEEQGPEEKVPGAEHEAAQGVQVMAAPLVPRDVVPALHRHTLPAADHVAPATEHEHNVVPFVALELPAPQALQAKVLLAAADVELQPKPAAQVQDFWPGCASAPSEK